MNYTAIDEFRNQMREMDEKLFFFAYENYVGKVDTPYNKPDLEDDMVSFMLDKTHQDALLRAFDKLDGAICFFSTAVPICNQQALECFFVPCLTKSAIDKRIENLKKRLILIQSTSNDRISINRLLSERIINERSSLMTLLEFADPISHMACQSSWSAEWFVGASTILAVASSFTKSRKKPRSLARSLDNPEIFPLLPGQCRPIIISNIVSLLASMSGGDGSKRCIECRLPEGKLAGLLGWTPLQIAVYAAAAGDAGTCACIIQSIEILKKLGQMQARQMIGLLKLELLRLGEPQSIGMVIPALLHLIAYNVIRAGSDQIITPNAFVLEQAGGRRSEFIESSSTEFNFYGEPSTADAPLAYLAEIRSLDMISSYSISYQGYVILNDISPDPSPLVRQFSQNLISSTISKYDAEFRRFTVNDGYLIESSDHSLSQTIRSIEALKPYLIKEVTPDIFLFSYEGKEKWSAILQQFINIDLKLSNVDFRRDESRCGFEWPAARIEDFDFILDKEIDFTAREQEKRLKSLITHSISYKPQLEKDISSRLVISKSQFDHYLTVEALAGSRHASAAEGRLAEIIGNKGKKALIKMDGKTMVVLPVGIENEELVFQEYPSMEEKRCPLIRIQSATEI